MKKLVIICCLGLFASATLLGQDKTNLSDAESASVAVVANQIDIEFAEMAIKKSRNAEILDFAKRMVQDHQAVIGQASALVSKLGVQPQDNPISQSMLADARLTQKELRKAPRKAFDARYIANEVAYHKAVIEAIRDVLVPNTENGELKELLQTVLPALEAHLGHAEMVQKKLGK